jgi:RNA polymerase sigma-70 factor (ECF subfamily)
MNKKRPIIKTLLDSKSALTRYIATFFIVHEDVEDTIQEAFEKVLIAEKTTEIQSPKAYLFRIARNIALNKKKRQQQFFEETMGSLDVSIVIDGTPPPFDQVYGQEKMHALQDALDKLPPQCRRVFLLQRVAGLSYKEIAKKLNISPRTVEKHLQKALQRCTEHFIASGFFDPPDSSQQIDNIEFFEDYRNRLTRND